MKKKYEVNWYVCNLTKEASMRFFTKLAAVFFAAYLKAYENVKPKIKEL